MTKTQRQKDAAKMNSVAYYAGDYLYGGPTSYGTLKARTLNAATTQEERTKIISHQRKNNLSVCGLFKTEAIKNYGYKTALKAAEEAKTAAAARIHIASATKEATATEVYRKAEESAWKVFKAAETVWKAEAAIAARKAAD